jgi:rRNA-processing protein Efg1
MARRESRVDYKSPGHPRSSFQNDRYGQDEAAHLPKRRKTDNMPDSEIRMNPARRSQLVSTGANDEPIQPFKTHTRNDRKTNRSSRIHSIRNLLARGDLPPNIKIEKEREIAGLLFDQQKDKLAKETAQMITKYHKIRFFERRKAERNLRRLTKQRDVVENTQKSLDEHRNGIGGYSEDRQEASASKTEREAQLKPIDQQIREARIDLSYTLYSPLTEKYISLFAEGPKAATPRSKEPETQLMKVQDQKQLSTQQSQELESQEEDNNSPMNTSDYSTKPPMWHEVERIMYPSPPASHTRKAHRHTTTHDNPDIKPTTSNGIDTNTKEAIKKHLSLLREGKLTTNNHNTVQSTKSGKRLSVSAPRDKSGNQEKKPSHDRRDGKRKRGAPPPPPSEHEIPEPPKKSRAGGEGRLDQDGNVDTANVDLADDSKANGDEDKSRSGDSDSDGDGGFFER